jgi:myosin heavy subunit
LSTLTKVLIVLLTVFSIFLCGIVITYVAHADNHFQKAQEWQNKAKSAEKKQEAAEKSEVEAKAAAQAHEAELAKEISDLKIEITKLTTRVADLTTDREKAEAQLLTEREKGAQDTKLATEMKTSWTDAEARATKLTADLDSRNKDINELNATLMAKMTQLADLEQAKRQLTEANQDLSNRLNQYLQQYGKMAAAPKLATPTTSIARPVAPQPERNLNLTGKIVSVDFQNNLAAVSLGSAEGVRKDMTFQVIRGDQYICDIVINTVDPDKAVGQLNHLDRNRAEPRIGDVVSTNL